MAINPNISLQVQTPQFADPIEQQGKAANLLAFKRQAELAPLQMQRAQEELKGAQIQNRQAEQAQRDQDDWRKSLMESGGDLKKARELAVQRGVNPKLILSIDEQITKAADALAGLHEKEFKNFQTQLDLRHDALAGVNSVEDPQQQAAVWSTRSQELVKAGIIKPEQVQQYPGPEGVRQMLAETVTLKALNTAAAEKRAQDKAAQDTAEHKARLPKLEAESDQQVTQNAATQLAGATERQGYFAIWKTLPANVANKFPRPGEFDPKTTPDKVRALGMTPVQQQSHEDQVRGQDMTTASSEAARRIQLRGQEITLRGQNMNDARTRELNEINRENKPPSSAELRAVGFYNRAQDAAIDLEKMEAEMQKKGWLGQAVYKHLGNWAQSQLNQEYRQAQRRFTEARLRKDSGAAIPPHEYEADSATYFPEPGDTPETLKKKASSRESLLNSLHMEAGRAVKLLGNEPGQRPGSHSAPANPNPTGYIAGHVYGGMTYVGGDPNNPASWRQ